MPAPPHPDQRPRLLLALLLAAVLAWGAVALHQRAASAVQRHIDAGIAATHRLQGLEAEREWRAAVRLDPRSADAWYLLGEYYLSANKYAAALGAYQHLLRLRPHAADVEAHLATCSLRTGNESAALQYARDALRDDPNNVEALTVAAPLLGGLNDEKGRLEDARRLARLRPDDVSAQTMLATALSDNHLYAESGPVLDHLLALDPNSAEAYALRGEARFNQDPTPSGLAQAEADFRRAVQINPGDGFAHLFLGRVAERQGRTAEAIAQLSLAARLRPDQPDPLFELAQVYDRAGQPQKAEATRARFTALRQRIDLETHLENQASVDPHNFEARRQRGLLALGDGDYRKASYYLNAAHALRPDDPQTNAALPRLAALRERLSTQGR